MNVRFKHQDCEHCRSFYAQAIDTIESFGFRYVGIGNNLGHAVSIDLDEEEEPSEL